jgi:hypothetical protein
MQRMGRNFRFIIGLKGLKEEKEGNSNSER